jgi:hypothetical protein
VSKWKQKIEAQIVSLKAEEREARAYDDEDYGDLFKETYTMLQALLDIAVAAEVANRGHWSVDGHFDGDPSAEPYFAVLNRALDKLREVGDA